MFAAAASVSFLITTAATVTSLANRVPGTDVAFTRISDNCCGG